MRIHEITFTFYTHTHGRRHGRTQAQWARSQCLLRLTYAYFLCT